MQERDIKNCYFLPLSLLQKVTSFIRNKSKDELQGCHQSLLRLQLSQNHRHKHERGSSWCYKTIYWKCINSAIYSHDWDKLLYFLKKKNIMHNRKYLYSDQMNYEMVEFYQRAYTILLMNHPYAKENFLLDDFLHMVLSCRSPENKQAVMKVLTSLTDTLYVKVAANKRREDGKRVNF